MHSNYTIVSLKISQLIHEQYKLKIKISKFCWECLISKQKWNFKYWINILAFSKNSIYLTEVLQLNFTLE